jgi:hypothetical protein
MKKITIVIIITIIISSCNERHKNNQVDIQTVIQQDTTLFEVYKRAKELIATGFNAGTVYQEVWIRDYNTFIEISCDVMPRDIVRENLVTFFKFQGRNGDIIDGFVPKEQANVNYKYRYSDLAPDYAGHKNTVETDQESSLVQAVAKYIQETNDFSILTEDFDGKSGIERLDFAMEYLINHRLSEDFGLIWGATTADWGDVQPEHEWGVELDSTSHLSIDIYDNAMFIIALENLITLHSDNERVVYWTTIKNQVFRNTRDLLWDSERQKFLPHLYIGGSPFPNDFDESQLHFHGGTAVAIEAGLLNPEEILAVYHQMQENVKESGAPSIGLTIYPPYPEGFFKNPSMYPYGYQNGGDWTWFGARMVRQLAENGYKQEAYEALRPMINRVIENNGFYEWYTIDGKPTGAGKFRGSAGVLATAIESLW